MMIKDLMNYFIILWFLFGISRYTNGLLQTNIRLKRNAEDSEDTSSSVCMDSTNYCGVGHGDCIYWRSQYPIAWIFDHTTVCQSYNSGYYCRINGFFSDWDYCKYLDCSESTYWCKHKVFYVPSYYSLQVHMSSYDQHFILINTNSDDNYCATVRKCYYCSWADQIIDSQFSRCGRGRDLGNNKYEFSGLSRNTRYTFYVLPLVTSSKVGRIWTFEVITNNAKPSTPCNIQFYKITTNAIAFRWSQSSDWRHYGKAEKFEIVYNGSQTTKFETYYMSFSVSSLKYKTNYCFSLVSVNSVGRSEPYYQCVSTKGEPNIPQNIQFRSVSSTSITVFWNASTETIVYGAAEEYEIIARNVNDENYKTKATFLNLHNLKPCTKYCFIIFAMNIVGKSQSSKSHCINTKTSFDKLEIIPKITHAAKSVIIGWEYANTHKCKVFYRVEYFTKNQKEQIKFKTQDTKLLVLDDVLPNETYYIRVRAEGNNETGEFSKMRKFQGNDKSFKIIESDRESNNASRILGILIPVGILIVISIIITSVYKYKKEMILKYNPDLRLGTKNENVDNRLKDLMDMTEYSFTNRSVYEFKKEFNFENDKSKLITEFEKIGSTSESFEKSIHLTTNSAELPENQKKNKFRNILPFDQTRVVLTGKNDGNDYINASYIPFYNNRETTEYIATQNPLEDTLSDFCLMVWEQNISLIVMLAKCGDDKKSEIIQYWPDELSKSKTFGEHINITATLIYESIEEVYIERKFTLTRKSTNEEKNVIHLQMQSWSDYALPKMKEFDRFLFRFHELIMTISAPFMIHCSAGVGRTGTFIIIDRIIRKLTDGKRDIDIYNEVLELRKYRRCMVHRQEQYNYVYEFLHYFVMKYVSEDEEQDGLDYINCNDEIY